MGPRGGRSTGREWMCARAPARDGGHGRLEPVLPWGAQLPSGTVSRALKGLSRGCTCHEAGRKARGREREFRGARPWGREARRHPWKEKGQVSSPQSAAQAIG